MGTFQKTFFLVSGIFPNISSITDFELHKNEPNKFEVHKNELIKFENCRILTEPLHVIRGKVASRNLREIPTIFNLNY